jgi:hypothetical protein
MVAYYYHKSIVRKVAVVGKKRVNVVGYLRQPTDLMDN